MIFCATPTIKGYSERPPVMPFTLCRSPRYEPHHHHNNPYSYPAGGGRCHCSLARTGTCRTRACQLASSNVYFSSNVCRELHPLICHPHPNQNNAYALVDGYHHRVRLHCDHKVRTRSILLQGGQLDHAWRQPDFFCFLLQDLTLSVTVK